MLHPSVSVRRSRRIKPKQPYQPPVLDPVQICTRVCVPKADPLPLDAVSEDLLRVGIVHSDGHDMNVVAGRV